MQPTSVVPIDDPYQDGFFGVEPLDCVSGEQSSNCEIDAGDGFFTPIVPSQLTTPPSTESHRRRPASGRRGSTAGGTASSSVAPQPGRRRTVQTKAHTTTSTSTKATSQVPTTTTVVTTPTPCPSTARSVRVASSGPHLLDSLWVDVAHTPRPQHLLRTTTSIASTTSTTTTTTRRPTTTTSTAPTTTTTPTTPLVLNDSVHDSEVTDDSGLPPGDAIDYPAPSTTSKPKVTPIRVADDHVETRTLFVIHPTDPVFFAVRPTTPMGPTATTATLATLATASEFPKTPFILFVSGAVIAVIILCLLWMFCCWRQQQASEKQPTTGLGNFGPTGYTPIPCEASPQQEGSLISRSSHTVVPTTILRTPATTTMGNGFGTAAHHPPAPPVAFADGVLANSNNKKRDFKEWYV